MTETIEVPVDLLRRLADPEPCELDHAGGCQAHSAGLGGDCPQKELKELLESGPRAARSQRLREMALAHAMSFARQEQTETPQRFADRRLTEAERIYTFLSGQ